MATVIDAPAPHFSGKCVGRVLTNFIATLPKNTGTTGCEHSCRTQSLRTAKLSRSDFLSKFVPLPSPNVPSCVGALVERMAARMLIFFVRHASLVS
jgi:hypothetical protein